MREHRSPRGEHIVNDTKKQQHTYVYTQLDAERKWSLKFLPFCVDSNFTQVQSRNLLTANTISHSRIHTNIYTFIRHKHVHTRERTRSDKTFDGVFG